MIDTCLPYPLPFKKQKKYKFPPIENTDSGILYGHNSEAFNGDCMPITGASKPFFSFIYQGIPFDFQCSVTSMAVEYLPVEMMADDPIEPKKTHSKRTGKDVKKNTLKQKVYEQFLKIEGYKDHYEEPEMIRIAYTGIVFSTGKMAACYLSRTP